MKFGALTPCLKCGAEPKGDVELYITFSDHVLTEDTLEKFGGIVRQLAQLESDPGVRFWAFITFLSRNYAQLLTADPPEAYAERTDTILREVKCVPIEVVRVPPRPNGLGQRSRLIQEAVPK